MGFAQQVVQPVHDSSATAGMRESLAFTVDDLVLLLEQGRRVKVEEAAGKVARRPELDAETKEVLADAISGFLR